MAEEERWGKRAFHTEVGGSENPTGEFSSDLNIDQLSTRPHTCNAQALHCQKFSRGPPGLAKHCSWLLKAVLKDTQGTMCCWRLNLDQAPVYLLHYLPALIIFSI